MKDYVIRKMLEINSTTAYVKENAKRGSIHSPYVLIAQRQTAGHGQYERSFESPDGGLYMSIYSKFPLSTDVSHLTSDLGVAISNFINEYFDISTEIKHPNDIFYGEKKLCGILVESYSDTKLNIITGIGLNINTKNESFSDEIQKIATSIYEITGKTYDIDTIAYLILEKIDEILNNL